MALTATYAVRVKGKGLYVLVLVLNATWTSGCLWGVIFFPPFAFILALPGLWTGLSFIKLLALAPPARQIAAKSITDGLVSTVADRSHGEPQPGRL